MRTGEGRPPESEWASLVAAAFQTAVSVPIIWAGIRATEAGVLLIGLPMIALGAITAALSARRIVVRFRSPDDSAAMGELPKSEFDYLVWISFAFPMIAVLLLLVYVLTRTE